MTYINNSLTNIEKVFYTLLENISLEEKKSDLDRYYLNMANTLCNDLKMTIVDYENKGKSDKLLITHNGWRFIPENQNELPNIYLVKRKSGTLAEWINKFNCIVLYILNDNNQIDNLTKQYISISLSNTLAYELTHYFTDTRASAAGRSIPKAANSNDLTKYYNDKSEIEAFTKSLENYAFNDVKNSIPILHSGITIEDQVDLLGTILNTSLYDCKSNKNNEFYEFLNHLTEPNLKKVYKDVYQYAIDEYIKNFAYTDYSTNMQTMLRKKLYNSDLLNAWFKQHKF